MVNRGRLKNLEYFTCKNCGTRFYKKYPDSHIMFGKYNIPVAICPSCGNNCRIVPSVREIANIKNSRNTMDSF